MAARNRYLAEEAVKYDAFISRYQEIKKTQGYAAGEAFWTLERGGVWQEQQARELRDLTDRLRGIVGLVTLQGLSVEGYSNVDWLLPEIGRDKLDGLRYGDGSDDFAVVTTDLLFSQWLPETAERWPAMGSAVPQDPETALRSEFVYSRAVEFDKHVVGFGTLPVVAPTSAIYATAMLGLVTDDRDFMYLPTNILAAVVADRRVYILSKKLATELQHIETCDDLWRDYDRKSQQFYRRLQAFPSERDRLSKQLHATEDDGDRAYEECFAAHMKEQPNFPKLVREVQALVDATHKGEPAGAIPP